jgi:hypothetical protein
MSANKTNRTRKAGSPAFPKQKPRLKLLKPNSECSTTKLIIELPQEVKEMLREQKRRRVGMNDDDAPEAT